MTINILDLSPTNIIRLNLHGKGIKVSHEICRHWVDNGLLYAVKFSSNNSRQYDSYTYRYKMHQWCKEYIGEENYSWAICADAVVFKTDEDAVLFKLRWG